MTKEDEILEALQAVKKTVDCLIQCEERRHQKEIDDAKIQGQIADSLTKQILERHPELRNIKYPL